MKKMKEKVSEEELNHDEAIMKMESDEGGGHSRISRHSNPNKFSYNLLGVGAWLFVVIRNKDPFISYTGMKN